jgi:alpha-amylase
MKFFTELSSLGNLDYPGVPFGSGDFHQPYCEINNYQNPDEVRNCYLVTLNDLDGGKDYVRGKIADYLNDLVNIGVKGFRVDASKHMWPGDLEAIQVSFLSAARRASDIGTTIYPPPTMCNINF